MCWIKTKYRRLITFRRKCCFFHMTANRLLSKKIWLLPPTWTYDMAIFVFQFTRSYLWSLGILISRIWTFYATTILFYVCNYGNNLLQNNSTFGLIIKFGGWMCYFIRYFWASYGSVNVSLVIHSFILWRRLGWKFIALIYFVLKGLISLLSLLRLVVAKK